MSKLGPKGRATTRSFVVPVHDQQGGDREPGPRSPSVWCLPVEVYEGVSAANALHPESLIPRDVGRDVGVGDDHLRGERLVDAVASAVEVGAQHYGPGTCGNGLPRVGAGALE